MPDTKSDAEQVALALIEHFLKQNSFEGVESSNTSMVPASVPIPAGAQMAVGGFHGLSVRGVGYADGELVDPRCYVYVTRSTKKHEKLLPERVGEVPVIMRKVGNLQIKPEIAASSSNGGHAYRFGGKVACGGSIAPTGAQYAGTLGAFLRDGSGDTYLLSNNHVIGACNHLPQGHPITAPSGIDAKVGSDPIVQVGALDRLYELRSGAHTYVPTQRTDAALARVTDARSVSSMQGNWYDTPSTVSPPMAGMKVRKVGRTTGHTFGWVESKIPVLMPLPYKSKDFTATVNFAEVWVVVAPDDETFALPGDSGSLVVNEDASAAVGLLFACSPDGKRGIITSLPEVLSDIGQGFSLLSGLR